jgi:phospholipase C
MKDLSKIEHVVVLMLENRSFDHVFGGLKREGGRIDVDLEFTNSDESGHMHDMRPMDAALASSYAPDPRHGSVAVERQIAGGRMSGFIRDMQASHGARAPRPESVLHYLTREQQPISYFFAEQFTVLERYFASIPTETLPNRFYSLCGTSGGQRDNHIRRQLFLSLRHVFDDLPLTSWKVYAGALPTLLMVGGLLEKRENRARMARIRHFFDDAHAGRLPRLSWIEPVYDWSQSFLARVGRVPEGPPNDDHPPSHTARGQWLLHDVYSALIARPDRWAKTLLIVNYDEHGGFADHVPPPRLATADIQSDGFDSLGPRVPAWLISPFAPRAGRVRTVFDHCSVLRFIAEWFGTRPLGRAASENTRSIADALLDDARTDTAPMPPAPPPVPKDPILDEERPPGDVELTVSAYMDHLEREDPDRFADVVRAFRGEADLAPPAAPVAKAALLDADPIAELRGELRASTARIEQAIDRLAAELRNRR